MSAEAYVVIGTLGAAGISGVASILVALLRTRGELRADHADVKRSLDRIEDRIDGHLEWHAEHPQE
jgi:hypothetical protein